MSDVQLSRASGLRRQALVASAALRVGFLLGKIHNEIPATVAGTGEGD